MDSGLWKVFFYIFIFGHDAMKMRDLRGEVENKTPQKSDEESLIFMTSQE